MISVEEAYQIIHSVSIPVTTSNVPIVESVARVLAEDIVADRDFPPFNRVAMDGIAINSAMFNSASTYFIENVQAAGVPQKELQSLANCMEVMTGAVLPFGTDAVIRYEDIDVLDGYAKIKLDEVRAFMNVHKQGSDAQHGKKLLTSGCVISPAEVALFASVGKQEISVYEFPRTAIVSSGDELIDISDIPQIHQVRRSNVFALQSAMHSMGWKAGSFHLRDDKDEISIELENILANHDIVILSGGVSKGKFDFIPKVLEKLGVKKLFHQVKQKPGKPFWFGVTASGKVVFALPGNPVSTFLCFHKYIKPWIRSMHGQFRAQSAILTEDVEFQPPLTYFLQVSIQCESGSLMATPVPGGGSGDFVNLGDTDGFLELPAGQSAFKKGTSFPFLPFR